LPALLKAANFNAPFAWMMQWLFVPLRFEKGEMNYEWL
jgi:hypothetical protein